MTEFVHYEQQDDIATVTMDDGKANAFGPTMIAALGDALERANSDAKVLLIKGRPGVFCAGFDLKEMSKGDDARQAMVNSGAELLLKLYLHPQPIVVASGGHALAAGALLLLCGDYRIGQQGEFKIGLNETAIGMTMPTFGIEMARDRLGSEHLTQAVLNAQLYSPDEALTVNYLDQVATPESFDQVIEGRLKSLLALDSKAYAGSKLGIRGAVGQRIRASLN